VASNTVVLINPDREKPLTAPLPLDYLAAALEHNGYEPELLDLAFESDWYAATSQAVAKRDILAIIILVRHLDDGLYNSQTYFLPKSKTLVEYLRSKTKSPIILVGGAYTLVPEELLRFCNADFGVAGDPEEAVPQLLDALRDDGDFSHVPNIGWIDNREFRQHPVEPANLCSDWSMQRGFIDNVRYFSEGGVTRFETKRGCGLREIYSTEAITRGETIRLRDPEQVAQEIENLADEGIYSLAADDTHFNQPRDHAMDVCAALTARGLRDRVRWYATCTPRTFDKELAEAMAAAGCQGIHLRVDSGDNEQLERLGHTHTPDDVMNITEIARQADILTLLEVVIGGPGESRDSIDRTISMLKASNPDMVSVQYGLRVYPYTPLGHLVAQITPLRDNFHLRGAIYNNDKLLRPVFYIESLLGRGVEEFMEELIDHDPKYLFPFRKDMDKTYNYNDPTILTEAILHEGHRGAHWDIWRRLIHKLGPLTLNGDRPTRGRRRTRRVTKSNTQVEVA
jgi:radical SAM superfamily enzyme YgiQ (UPF0313 family)